MKYRISLIVLASLSLIITPVFAEESITIIESESNPAGTDAGNEWIKLFNSGNGSVDLSGWSLRTDDGQIFSINNITIQACSETKITFSSQFLDNQQERVSLLDSNQITIDQTPIISDTDNDDNTWSIPEPVCEVLSPNSDETEDILTMVFVDLGTKGESIIVIYPNGKTLLIDGGMPGAYSNLESTLKQHNISNIDIMMGTHADQDHIAGLTKVLEDEDFTVNQVLTSHISSDTDTYQNFLTEIADNNLQPQTVFAGHEITLDNSVSSHIISPPDIGIDSGTHATPSNSNSLVTQIEYGDVSFLLTSDASFTTEEYILQNSLDIDIMNSPHHGSKYSSTDEFLDGVTPKLIIISSDQDNVYGHPDSEVISKYEERNINYFQTGLDGNTVIKTDGIRCSIFVGDMPEQPCYSGIQTIPEFEIVMFILLSSIIPIVLISRKHNLRHEF